MRRPAAIAVLAVAACTRPAAPPQAGGDAGQRPSAAPPSEIPSPLSHGEAVVGSGATPGKRAAEAPQHSTARTHHIRMRATHVTHQVAPGVSYQAWTFDDVVPGPVVRVTVGDRVEFTLVNDSPMPHSMDFHAAEIAPNRAFVNVNPGDSISFVFEPRIPGAFMYHCGTAPTAAHIANGMYGAIIVDPIKPLPEAREFVLVQSEFYLDAPAADGGPRRLDWNKMLSQAPDYVVFNGYASQYAASPIQVQPMERLRFYVVNAGPNRVSAFHVVGGIFDKVYPGGYSTPLDGVQTYNVPVGGGAVFETRLAEEGLYPFVTHAFADATKGAVGVLRAGNPSGSMSH